MNIHWTLILLWHFLNVGSVNARKIPVEWLPTSPYVIKNISSNGIFCPVGTPKRIEKLWWTLEIHVKVISGKVTLHSGESPKAVFDNYEGSIEAGSKFHAVSVKSFNPFITACVAVNFTENNNQHANHSQYDIQVSLTSVDHWRVKLMATGMIMIFVSAFLTSNPVVICLFVSISVPILLVVRILYFICQHSATHCVLTSSLLIACVTFLDKYFHMYVLVTGVISFLVAYDPRSKNIMILWVFQGAGIIMIRWSTWYEEASMFIATFALGMTYYCKGKRN